MLPELDGLEIMRRLRADPSSDVPVILLTARSQEVDRIYGLELGADDYVTKPFSPAELVSRVKAVLRRAQRTAQGGQDEKPLDYGEIKDRSPNASGCCSGSGSKSHGNGV